MAVLMAGLAGGPATTEAHPAQPLAIQQAQPRVGLQVGHWKIGELPAALARLRGDTGAVAAGHREVTTNLDLAQRTARLLQAAGVTVDVLPATVPTDYRADAFVAIHADANSSRWVNGYKIATRWRSGGAARDELLVERLDAAYHATTGLAHDSAVTRNMRGYYAINTWLGDVGRISDLTPAAIIETGYMTSATDRALLYGDPDRVATGIARGILDFLRGSPATEALQARAETIAAAAPTDRSVLVVRNNTPIRATAQAGAPIVGRANYGDVLPYLDTIIRPKGPFTSKSLNGTALASDSGVFRVGVPGSDTPGYISRDALIVQQPNHGVDAP